MNFTIVSMHNDKFKNLTDITISNKQEYAERYGYKLILDDFTGKLPTDKENYTYLGDGITEFLTQYKFKLLLSALENAEHSGWIVWIDADVLIMNYTLPLTTFTDEYDLIIGEDWNGVNGGVMFLKVGYPCIDLMNHCINFHPSNEDKILTPWWWWQSEQCAMTRCMSQIKTKVVHHSEFNGYIIGPRLDNDWRNHNIGPSDPNWQPKLFQQGDFAIHLVGDFIEGKIKNAKNLLGKIIK